jgi:hypothetical protein
MNTQTTTVTATNANSMRSSIHALIQHPHLIYNEVMAMDQVNYAMSFFCFESEEVETKLFCELLDMVKSASYRVYNVPLLGFEKLTKQSA